MQLKELNLNQIWQDSFGWKGEKANPRKLDDRLEREFWERTAPCYTEKYNLNNDSPLLAEALQKRIAPRSSILEIGPGSGNFTLPMAAYAEKVLGLDMAPAMLRELERRVKQSDCRNVETVCGKWEDYTPQEPYDYIVSVNSLYRIRDMEGALMKMYRCVKKGIILLRTIQRPFFFPLYRELGLACEECTDYQLLPLYFWQHDIHAEVEFLEYRKKKCFAAWEEVEAELLNDLGAEQFGARKEEIMSALRRAAAESAEGLCFSQGRTTVVIAVKK